ncbi:hypothetical protein FLK61_26875 [Paenalkalicoccus suaedae]|uniref:Uncharacterized protein n=1 Tax=Paenalkalicoccus suaedae TaxID=2592382 RepID=A0A859FBP2_9BACI|nr:hypothetical protein [Paenalkalicoccus suaedae]QKS70380.1 hypothetical protein FLK61_26875 [Paenalkalicoccus suaedae]
MSKAVTLPSTPTVESLQALRRYHDVDIRRMYNNEAIYKDYKGFYLFEVELHAHNGIKKPKRVYIEPTFQAIEKAILSRHKQAEATFAEMMAIKKKKERKPFLLTLLRLDFELYYLYAAYSGKDGQSFLSFNQIMIEIEDKLSYGLVYEGIIAKETTPLTMGKLIPPCVGKRLPASYFETTEEKGFYSLYKREDYYLYTMPYGMNREKEQ